MIHFNEPLVFWTVWTVGLLLVLSFGAVLLIGAPYVPTLKDTRKQAMDLLNLKPGQTLYELGSGDGGMLIEAAKRGINAVGYEINPFLVAIAWFRCLRYGKRIKIVWGNYWHADLGKADAVFVFLLERFMGQLDKKIEAERGAKHMLLATHAFKIPGKRPVGRKGAMFLYEY